MTDARDDSEAPRHAGGVWHDLRRGMPRALAIAAVVGTFLVAVNQGARVLHPTTVLAVRVAVTYLTPFVVSMAGWLSACRAMQNGDAAR